MLLPPPLSGTLGAGGRAGARLVTRSGQGGTETLVCQTI